MQSRPMQLFHYRIGGAVQGLKLAWNVEFKIILESDYNVLVDMVNFNLESKKDKAIHLCRDLLIGMW